MRKSINFDFSQRVPCTRDTKKLKEYYLNKNYTEAYNDIKKFLIKNGFEHRQGSGYISKDDMTKLKIAIIIEELNNNYSWLYECCKTFYYSDIGQEYDALLSIKEDKSKTLEADKTQEKISKPKESRENDANSVLYGQNKRFEKTRRVEKPISNYQLKNKNKTNDKDIER